MGTTNFAWPSLRYEEWKDTYATLHLWTQIAGKYRLILSPWLNHSWHATFYLTSRGITSSPIPYRSIQFQLDFDFLSHRFLILASDGSMEMIELRPRSVADFYREVLAKMNNLGIDTRIHGAPNEVAVPIPFDQDEKHASYDPDYASRWWRIQLSIDRVFKEFRAQFIGKCSPVHLFWGAFDLAVTRFSGRTAPEHPGNVPHLPDRVAKEAYSHEVSSAGFWPGSEQAPQAYFYSYAYPEPAAMKEAPIQPGEAFYSPDLREFLLPYEAVRNSSSPEETLLRFLQTTYDAAAETGQWDRGALEKPNKI
jgi:hypothetical protein